MIRIGYSRLSLLLTFVVLSLCVWHMRWKEGQWKDIISSDARGYYAYLPAVFIYHDLQYTAIIEMEQKVFGNSAVNYLKEVEGGNLNQYFAGETVLLSPFFFMAHTIAILSDRPADGYSQIYQEFVSLAALFYLFLGLWLLRKLLMDYKIRDEIIAITILLFVFGTNLFHYVITEPGMSHVYSFALITCFIWFARKCIMDYKPSYVLWSTVSLALVCLARPNNAVVIVLLPFLAESSGRLKDVAGKILRSYNTIGGAFLFFLLIASIQPLLYYLQVGRFFVDSYLAQDFNFTTPQIVNVLFSYRKGLFVYTPLLLLSMGWFGYALRRLRYQAAWLLVFFFLMIYIISSWFMWYYGGSFGMRPVIDYYAVFALLLALWLNELKHGWSRVVVIAAGLLLLGVNQVQAYQYRNYILDWDRMTKHKYWKVFLKTDQEYRGLFWEKVFTEDVQGDTLQSWRIGFERAAKDWKSLESILPVDPHADTRWQQLDSTNIYGATLELENDSMLQNNVRLVVTTRLNTYFQSDSSKAGIVLSIDTGSASMLYLVAPLRDLIPYKTLHWQQSGAAFKLPYISTKKYTLKVYVLYERGEPFYIDDFEVNLVDAKIW